VAELALVIALIVSAVSSVVDRVLAGRRWEAERAALKAEAERLLATLLAKDVSPAAAVAVARPRPERPAGELDDSRRIIPIDL